MKKDDVTKFGGKALDIAKKVGGKALEIGGKTLLNGLILFMNFARVETDGIDKIVRIVNKNQGVTISDDGDINIDLKKFVGSLYSDQEHVVEYTSEFMQKTYNDIKEKFTDRKECEEEIIKTIEKVLKEITTKEILAKYSYFSLNDKTGWQTLQSLSVEQKIAFNYLLCVVFKQLYEDKDNFVTLKYYVFKDEIEALASIQTDERFELMKDSKLIISNRGKHTVISLNKDGMVLLIPDGYTKGNIYMPQSFKKKYAGVNWPIFNKNVETSRNEVTIFNIPKERLMSFDEKTLIDEIHNSLGDRQGLIKVKSGKTKRGYDYIYSIVKTVGEPWGVFYFVRLQLKNGNELIEVNGAFDECGTTGIREAVVTAIAHKLEMLDFSSDKLDGWNEDPYDKTFKKGIQKNLAEYESFDRIFQDNPLSQAREFLLAIIEDKIVIPEKVEPLFKKKEDGDKTLDDYKKEYEKKYNKEFKGFEFNDECKRDTFDVVI